MTSKIINMAERIKDDSDRMLDSMFASDPIADDGFSARIVRNIRRKIWLRRLTLPVATLIGGLIAFKPMTEMVRVVVGLTTLIPEDIMNASETIVPQLPMLVLGAMLLAAILVGVRTLED